MNVSHHGFTLLKGGPEVKGHYRKVISGPYPEDMILIPADGLPKKISNFYQLRRELLHLN